MSWKVVILNYYGEIHSYRGFVALNRPPPSHDGAHRHQDLFSEHTFFPEARVQKPVWEVD